LKPHLPSLPRLHAARHDAARGDEISWTSLVRTARISYAFQALVAIVLLLPPQLRDMLAAMTETHDLRAWIAFPASMAIFGLSSWYWARASISARFDLPDTARCWDDAVDAGRAGHRPFIRHAPLHIVPQAPIPIAGLTGLLLAWESRAWLLGLATLACLLAVWFLVNHRQAIRAWLHLAVLGHTMHLDDMLNLENPELRSTYSVRLWLRRVPYRFAKIMQRAPSGVWPASILLGLSMFTFTATGLASAFPAEAPNDWRNLIWTVWHGPTPVLLGCALMIGPFTVLSFVLDGWRMSVWIRDAPLGLGRPPLILGTLLAGIILPNASALHGLRTIPGPLPRRPTLEEHWAAWQATCGADTRPVVVAISGGAARAALWGSAVLAQIDRAAQEAGGQAAEGQEAGGQALWGRNTGSGKAGRGKAGGGKAAIYAISTISGGSLGAAAYLAARAGDPPPGLGRLGRGGPGTESSAEADPPPAGPAHAGAGDPANCQLSPDAAARFEPYAKTLDASDAIGPLLAGFVFSDVPRGLFGWVPALAGAPLRGGDRAAALERAFEANAARAARRAGLPALALNAPYLSLSGPGMPLWLGVGTARDTGARVLVSPIASEATASGGAYPGPIPPGRVSPGSVMPGGGQWPFRGAADLLGQLGADLPISTAINATARAPFLEPSGTAPARSATGHGLVLIDGGYYDQSGMETALEVADWLRARGASPIVVAANANGDGSELGDGPGAVEPLDVVHCGDDPFRPDVSPAITDTAEALAPIIGLNEARAGHVDALLRRARDLWCAPHQSFFHFYLGARGSEPVPLNWVLSQRMADFVWRSAAPEGLRLALVLKKTGGLGGMAHLPQP
jgi:hypothetical protein